MSKVTSKLQVTVPKAIAEQNGIRPGDEIQWAPAGDSIRVAVGRSRPVRTVEERLKLFDQATERQRQREAGRARRPTPGGARGWKREELYDRGGPD